MHKHLWLTVVAGIFFLSLLPRSAAAIPENIERIETSHGPVFYYTIQKGDTLWDLSRKFYNSHWVWPGLWELNRDITNPHRIYPGQKIEVFLADFQSQTPTPPPSAAEPPASPSAPPPPPVIPSPPPVKTRQVWVDAFGFIKPTPMPAAGHILMGRNQNLLLTTGDIIYIDPLTPETFIPGSCFHVFSTETVRLKTADSRFKGIKHILKATLTITEVTEKHIQAEITRAIMPCAPGDPVMPLYITQQAVPMNPLPRPIFARVICSLGDNALLAESNIAFINAGKDQSVAPGDLYTLYKEQAGISEQAPRKNVTDFPLLKNGTLLVLHTEKDNATVKILHTEQEVLAGDIVK